MARPGSRATTGKICSAGRIRNRIIWHYRHGLHAQRRFSGRYETILWFTKANDHVFNLDGVRVPALYPGKHYYSQTCRQGQEKALGEKIVKGGRLEPDPVAGKRGAIEVSVQAAFDDQYVYLRFEWSAPRPGVGHELWRFDGTQWVPWGGPKPDATKHNIPASYEDRLALMITERNVPAANGAKTGFNQAGCFVACHNSMRNMPAAVSADRVRNHPCFGSAGLGVSDIRHYLLITRFATDETGGWDKTKTPSDIERLKAEGSFLDLWQWRAYRSSPMGYATDDHVLDYRLADAGRVPYTTPARPSFMYDQAKTGFRAIPESRYAELLAQLPLIQGVNAVPFDPAARFAVGDLLPRAILRTPEGSEADIMANGSWQNGKWVVELRRKLTTGNADDKPFKPGRVLRFGIGLFDDNVENRYHLVSFVQTLGLGAETTATVRGPDRALVCRVGTPRRDARHREAGDSLPGLLHSLPERTAPDWRTCVPSLYGPEARRPHPRVALEAMYPLPILVLTMLTKVV